MSGWIVKSYAYNDTSKLTETYIRDLLNITRIVPRQTHDKSDTSPFNIGFVENGNIYMPRQLIIDSGVEIEDRTVAVGLDRALKFEGELRREQVDVVNKVLSRFSGRVNGGIIQSPPGSGKTVMALKLVSELGLKTLVIVHKDFLVKQWTERIGAFIPDARVGRIQQDVVDVEGKDIVIGMMQSLSMRRYDDVYDRFGLVIIDEGHHLGARVFHKSIVNFGARYRLMLSATPYRADGCEKVFEYHIGRVIAKVETYEMTPKVYIVRTPFCIKDGTDKEVLTNILCGIPSRNEYITKLVKKAYTEGRKVIVFSKRLRHLDALARRLAAIGVDYCYFTGDKPDYNGVKRKRVILATVQMAKEGLDIADIDCEIFTVPQGNVEQDVGRALRLLEGKKKPIIIDIVDSNDYCIRTAKKRMEYYVSKKFEVISIRLDKGMIS